MGTPIVKDGDLQFIPAFLIEYSDPDSAFTNPHEALLPDDPPDCRGNYTHMGAKYWGIETRRHKTTSLIPGEDALAYDHNAHNWFHLGFKQRAEFRKITISTKWFTGNQVRSVSVYMLDELEGTKTKVLDRVSLDPDAEHEFTIAPTMATACRVSCFYEGGIARFNCFGVPTDQQLPFRPNLLENAKISHVSDQHYGKPADAVKGNREQMYMIGWESARTGFGEHAVFHLQEPAEIEEIVVDTYLHRLNPPLCCFMFGLRHTPGRSIDEEMQLAPRYKLVFDNYVEVVPENFQSYMANMQYLDEPGVESRMQFKIMSHIPKGSPWQPVLPFGKLRPDTYHRFIKLQYTGPFSHLLFMFYPNGGIHGLKVFGHAPAK